MNGKSGAVRSLPIGAFCFPFGLLCLYVCLYSSWAAGLFLGLWPEVHQCVANQQKTTGSVHQKNVLHTEFMHSCCSAAIESASKHFLRCVCVFWVENGSMVCFMDTIQSRRFYL